MKSNSFFQKHNDPQRFQAEMAIASPGKNWGFCSDECTIMNEEFKYNPSYTGMGLIVYLSSEECLNLLGVKVISHVILTKDFTLSNS